MSKEKQIEEKAIEEMARVIEITEQIARDAHCGLPSPKMYAKDLYWKGYRKQEWVSVDERLPSDIAEYIVMIQGAVIPTTLYYDPWKGVWYEYNRNLEYYVSHWMPLPEPPKMRGDTE